jgi:(p)ppGpp synthase/HD superfamily hydrolase
MRLTTTIQKAINVAAQKHRNKRRKADGLPYITHLVGVAWLLSDCSSDEAVVVAGFLHDVLEDVKGYDIKDLRRDFGDRVAGLVKAVSEDKDPNVETDERATWEGRKKKYLEHLRTAPAEAVLISAADKVHNLRSLKAVHEKDGDSIWTRFNASPERVLWFNSQVLEIANERLGSNQLVGLLRSALDDLKVILPTERHSNHARGRKKRSSRRSIRESARARKSTR